jgi:hypothetical protein
VQELGKCWGDAGCSGQDQGGAADRRQDHGDRHRPYLFTSRRAGPEVEALLVTVFSFRGRSASACGCSLFGCSSVGFNHENPQVVIYGQ